MKNGSLRILVVEDEPRNLDLLKRRLERLGAIVVGEAADAAEAWRRIENLHAARALDAVFMDIWLDYETAGIDIGRRLRDLPERPRLVFVSSHPEFQKYIWPCHPDYFVEKPVLGSELEAALARVREELGKSGPPPAAAKSGPITVNLRSRGGIWPIPSDRILCCGAGTVLFEDHAGKPQSIQGKIYLSDQWSERLEDWEALLAPQGFFRIHTSHLVNLARVQYLKPGPEDSHQLKLWGREGHLPIARNKWRSLLAALECREAKPSGREAADDPLPARWGRLWRTLKLAPPAALGEALLARYGEEYRRYHTRQHLEECLDWLDRAHGQCERPAEVELALWFHDAVYAPGRSDNEERSADWAARALLEAGGSPEIAGRVRELVLATGHHRRPETRDQRVMVDIDLAILGAPAERFGQYEEQIRQEYPEVPLDRFRAARREFLAPWLQSPRIYRTEFFRERLEKPARENLARLFGLTD